MTDAPHADAGDQSGLSQDGPPGIPRWVKIGGIVAGILVAILLVAMLVGGDHGPGRHMGTPSMSRDVSGPVSVR